MKIALCLSGYLRTFKDCWPSIKENLIQDNDVDIFIHTYDKIGNSSGWRSHIDLNENIDMDFLESIPNIKIIVTEKWDDIKYQFQKFRIIQPTIANIDAIATILYKIYKCNELKKQYEREKDFIYDLVIRTRGDQVFTKKINFNFDKNKILINAYPWGDEDFVKHFQVYDDNGVLETYGESICISDRFAIGTSENINYLCDLYNHFDKLIIDPIGVHLEHLLLKHLENKINLEKRKLNFYIKHEPPRCYIDDITNKK